MPFAEDMTVFFDTEEFASAALLDGVGVTGIFYNAWQDIDDVATTGPAYKLDATAAACAVEGQSQFVLGDAIDGVFYDVVGIRGSGAGTAVLKLRKSD
jgi:hypothetical protein